MKLNSTRDRFGRRTLSGHLNIMKLMRIGPPGQEVPVAVDIDGNLRDISSIIVDVSCSNLADPVLQLLRMSDLTSLPVLPPNRIGPCVGNAGKIVGIGLNYTDHAREAGLSIPEEPVIFLKAASAICGPNDDIVMPLASTKVDWEVELGIVIGSTARYVSEAVAVDHIAGFCIVNDLSERSFQFERGGTWDKGKSCETFAPLGPMLVTRDEILDANNLELSLKVNGVTYQQANTENMIFNVRQIVSYVSHFMRLDPGDVIATGTPAGVGLGQKPPVFLKEGDIVCASIQGLGEQRQRVTRTY